ncbi:hypothetical protein ACH4Q6_32215 [Streptomyces lydicus]|uniref:hypothetical protein n=1 Tax=Streptomyces lydicus TaxID=47763 RepID=UPI003795869E
MPTAEPALIFPDSSTGQDTAGRSVPARHSLSSWSKIGVSSSRRRRGTGGGSGGGWWGREMR